MGTPKRPSSGAIQVYCDAILWVKRPCAPIAIFQVRANDPHVFWPWEALYNPQPGAFFAHQQRLERRLKRSAAPKPPPVFRTSASTSGWSSAVPLRTMCTIVPSPAAHPVDSIQDLAGASGHSASSHLRPGSRAPAASRQIHDNSRTNSNVVFKFKGADKRGAKSDRIVNKDISNRKTAP
jgi:hypothetical protein